MADIGLLGIGGDVHQLRDVMGDRGQSLEPIGRNGPYVELEGQIRYRGRQVGIPARSPYPLMHPCTWVTPAWTATSEFATAHPASLWQWMPSSRAGPSPYVGHGLADVVGQGASVGVTEHEGLRAGLFGCSQHRQRELRVAPIAVEEVLGVEKDTQIVLAQIANRIGHHGHGFVQRRAQRLVHVPVPGLRHDAGDGRAAH